MAKDPNYIRMIQSKRWKDIRLKKLKAIPLCEVCTDNDKITPATEVHHIVPVETVTTISQMERLMFDYSNLMSICRKCHSEIHAKMFTHTKESVQKANDRRTQRFADRFLN